MANQNYILLERIELNDTAASVTFSNIPQTGYTDLKVVGSIRGTTTGNIVLGYQFNSSTSGYTSRTLYTQDGTTTSSSSETTFTVGATPWGRLMSSYVDGASQTANTFSSFDWYVPNYTSSNYKSSSNNIVMENNATANSVELGGLLWSNTAAISSISLVLSTGSFAQYSSFSLYGIANSSTTPVIAPKASGGNVIATDGTYWYHAFLSNGTFTPATGLSCEYLVIAGGGGGGYAAGGGGGAGGYRTGTGLSVTSGTSYAVTVGAGGTGELNTGGGSTNGTNSVFSTITSTGGGKGGGAFAVGSSGGSGGGGGQGSNGGSGNAGGYTPVEGYAGGNGGGAGKGGGGSSTVGADTSTAFGSVGGTSTNSSITGTSTAYAGGGGGGGRVDTGGSGGAGGGATAGLGGTNSNGGAASVNTGSGGGGGGRNGATLYAGGNGGSGIVIVRYLVA